MGRWTILQLLAISGSLAYLYHPVLADLVAQWSTDTAYGYGYFIPVVAGYLVWMRRGRLRNIAPTVSWWGYALFLGGLIALMVGHAGGIQFVARGSLVAVLFGLVLFLGGRQIARVVAFPLGFLALMIPPPPSVFAQITWPLQLFTARFATAVLRQVGYPVLLQGIFIDLPDMRLEVAQACSGIRSIIALLATGVVLAYVTQERWLDRAILVAAVLPIAIFANAARVTALIALRIFEDPLHSFSGWLVFVLATALLMAVSAVLGRGGGETRNARSEAAA